MLLNMTAGFVVLAFFLLDGLQGDRKRWAAPFAMVGLVAFLCGLHMIFTWPLPGAYNSAFGETSVLLGVIYLGIALSLAKEWNLAPIAIYGILAALVAVVLGVRIMDLKMTMKPELSGVGFILRAWAASWRRWRSARRPERRFAPPARWRCSSRRSSGR